MNGKKIFALALVLMLACALAACGKGAATDSGGAQSAQSAQNGAAAGADGFTVPKTEAARVSDMKVTGLRMGKQTYAVGEVLTVTVNWEGTPAEDAWIGIHPADTPHGSEETNDQYDIDYRYFTDCKSGDTFTFEIALEAGDYTMRVNESDSGGAELAWCGFSVR